MRRARHMPCRIAARQSFGRVNGARTRRWTTRGSEVAPPAEHNDLNQQPKVAGERSSLAIVACAAACTSCGIRSSRDARCRRTGDSGARGPSRSADDAALYARESECDRQCDSSAGGPWSLLELGRHLQAANRKKSEVARLEGVRWWRRRESNLKFAELLIS